MILLRNILSVYYYSLFKNKSVELISNPLNYKVFPYTIMGYTTQESPGYCSFKIII